MAICILCGDPIDDVDVAAEGCFDVHKTCDDREREDEYQLFGYTNKEEYMKDLNGKETAFGTFIHTQETLCRVCVEPVVDGVHHTDATTGEAEMVHHECDAYVNRNNGDPEPGWYPETHEEYIAWQAGDFYDSTLYEEEGDEGQEQEESETLEFHPTYGALAPVPF